MAIQPIVIENVCKRFGSFSALDDINLAVKAGDIAVIIGSSGSGKTTLLRIMVGLDRPSSGRVIIDGEDIASLSERALQPVRRKFGMVFQHSALLDSLTVLDNVALPLREHSGLAPSEIERRVLSKLRALELEGAENRFPAELSGGMRKRVGLARALIMEPKIVMYDEPTSGLDPLTARLVDDLIVRTRDQFGVTSVVISHDMVGATNIGDHLYLLDKGRLNTHGPPNELLSGQDNLASRFFEAGGAMPKRTPNPELPDAGSD